MGSGSDASPRPKKDDKFVSGLHAEGCVDSVCEDERETGVWGRHEDAGLHYLPARRLEFKVLD